MMKVIKKSQLGSANHGWLNTTFHFSFAGYYNPNNISFGTLRVLNNDFIAPHTGFDTHPHENMEIITYIISGELSHEDSMHNKRTIKRGDIQYLSAGTGIYHSERNESDYETHLFQIWVYPDKNGHKPNYGDLTINWNERVNKFLHIVSPHNGNAPIKINQDSNFYVSESSEDLTFHVATNRQAYIAIAEGSGTINGVEIAEGDGVEIIEESVIISPNVNSKLHFIVIEMKK